MKAEALTRQVAKLKELWQELKASGYVNDENKALQQPADGEHDNHKK